MVNDAVLRPTLRKGIVCRQLEDEYVIYDPVTDQTALLNLSAAALLELCDGTRTEDEITSEVAAAFQVKKDGIAGDIKKTLSDLAARGFLGPGSDE